MGLFKDLNHWYTGYLRIRVTGFGVERFLNLCCANKLEIWDLRPGKNEIHGAISIKDFRKIRPLVRKAAVGVRIEGRVGLPFVLYRNRKRKGLVAGFAGFFVLLYVLSLFVWNISFEGNYHYTRDTLMNYLQAEGIRYGMRKNLISCEAIEEGIRSQFPEITWVSASVSGTRLLVKIKENEVLSTIPEKHEEPCEVVAARDGTVTELVVRQGKVQVAVGDVVEKGQLLVSSELQIMNDSGEVTRTAYVHADADIYATTQYQYQEKVKKIHSVSVKTGKTRNGFGLGIGPYQWQYLTPSWGWEFWSYTSETTQLHLLEDFYLPIYFTRIQGEAYTQYDRQYTEDEIQKLSEQLQENYLKNLLEKGVHIIENSVKIQENGFFYIIDGAVTAREQIGEIRSVSATDQMTQENEETIEAR